MPGVDEAPGQVFELLGVKRIVFWMRSPTGRPWKLNGLLCWAANRC